MATGDSPESANHDNPRTTERCDYLAWNSDLDKLAKRRVMGHKAGDDVFARVYTLDHPSIAPLAAVASAVQADIELKGPHSSRGHGGASQLGSRQSATPTLRAHQRRVGRSRLADRTGRQFEPLVRHRQGDGGTRRCSHNGKAVDAGPGGPSTVDTEVFGNTRRRARLLDVLEVRDRLAARMLLRDIAEEIGVGYHPAWHAMNRLGIIPTRDLRTDELVLNADQVALLQAEFDRVAALKARSVRLSAAATRLSVAVSTVGRFVQTGDLEEDPDTDPSGARYVTLASVDALVAARARRTPPAVGTEVLSLAAVAELTGLTKGQISDLATQRVLVRRDAGRRLHITTDSLRRWAVGYRPDLIAPIESILAHSTPAVEPGSPSMEEYDMAASGIRRDVLEQQR